MTDPSAPDSQLIGGASIVERLKRLLRELRLGGATPPAREPMEPTQ